MPNITVDDLTAVLEESGDILQEDARAEAESDFLAGFMEDTDDSPPVFEGANTETLESYQEHVNPNHEFVEPEPVQDTAPEPRHAPPANDRPGGVPSHELAAYDTLAGEEEVLNEFGQTTGLYDARVHVEAAHPGWQKTIETTAFRDWQNRQPENIAVLAYSPKAAAAIEMISLYKKSKRSKRRAAAQPKSTTPSVEDEFLIAFGS